MTHILAISNQKGGVGKTTTAVNLAASLAAMKARVLLVDMDPQGNATVGCGIDRHQLPLTLVDVLLDGKSAATAVQSTAFTGLSVLPSHGDLTAAEVELPQQQGSETRLRDALAGLLPDYDYLLIDCPPALNSLTLNSWLAAQQVLVPMPCEYYAMEGLGALLQTLDQVRQNLHPELRLGGIIRTLYDPRSRLTSQVNNELFEHFPEQLFRSRIPRNIRLAEAPGFGKPVLYHDRSSRGAIAYLALAGELVRRLSS